MTPHSHADRCTQPVLLRGRVDRLDGSTGELIHRYTTAHEPGGVLRVACKTRRASRCPSCAETYRADTYQLIRAGLTGGKGVPATVAAHPCLFVTLTAPSFGPVHARRDKNGRPLPCRPRRAGGTCPHGRPLACNERHHADDPRTGTPICPDCYDYTGAVLFNATAPELWRRFTIGLRRTLARIAGMTQKELNARTRISFAKVAEYQKRGVVHFQPSSASTAQTARTPRRRPGQPPTSSLARSPSPRPTPRSTPRAPPRPHRAPADGARNSTSAPSPPTAS
jgi:hypothetical protein